MVDSRVFENEIDSLSQSPTKEEVTAFFEKLPEAQNRTYELRIATYQYHLSRVSTQKHNQELDRRIDEATRKITEAEEEANRLIEDAQTRTLQFLAFFAALLAIIISSVEIVRSFTFDQAAQLLLLLNGGLLSAFAGFSFILPNDSYRRTGLVLLTRIVIVVLGLLVELPT